jgi:hypothetical protein
MVCLPLLLLLVVVVLQRVVQQGLVLLQADAYGLYSPHDGLAA